MVETCNEKRRMMRVMVMDVSEKIRREGPKQTWMDNIECSRRGREGIIGRRGARPGLSGGD